MVVEELHLDYEHAKRRLLLHGSVNRLSGYEFRDGKVQPHLQWLHARRIAFHTQTIDNTMISQSILQFSKIES